MTQKDLVECVGLDQMLTSRLGPTVSLNGMDGRIGPNVPGNGQGTPIPLMATPSPPGGNPSPPVDGNIQGTPQRLWVPKKKDRVCSFWRAGSCLKGDKCDWLHQEPAGTAQDGGGTNPGAGGDNLNERNNDPDVPLCRWTKKAQPCYGIESGSCRTRPKVLVSDNLGSGAKGAGDTKM